MAHCLLRAPLVVIDSNGALWTRCAISMYGKMKKKFILVAHPVYGAPLVSSTLMAYHKQVRH